MKISIIIPTKDRFEYLKETFNFLSKNKFFFTEVIVVDSSIRQGIKIRKLCNEAKFKIKLLRSKASIAYQRNIGLKNLNKKTDFVMFLDDDITFQKDAFHQMRLAILGLDKNTVGFGFNLQLKKRLNFLDKLKKINIVKKLGIYNSKMGVVTPSGWQTIAYNFKKNSEVSWLSTQASIFKYKAIKNIYFDIFFEDYSYLEDLDFSYRTSKLGKLLLIHKAKYQHPNEIERSGYFFGKKEILNRYYFVKKNKLRFVNFLLGAIVKSGINLTRLKLSFFLRFVGNINSLIRIIFFLSFTGIDDNKKH